jgi:hypothetical protein
MLKSTPHPPPQTLAVQAPITIEAALLQACAELCGAAATAYEVADNATLEFRPLGRSVLTQIQSARALVEAALAGFIGQHEPCSPATDTAGGNRKTAPPPMPL